MDVNPAVEDPEAEAGKPGPAISADAGTDESIAKRLERDPSSKEARLDRGLDESMDASDPPASTQPVHSHSTLPESSGYNPHLEARLGRRKHQPRGLSSGCSRGSAGGRVGFGQVVSASIRLDQTRGVAGSYSEPSGAGSGGSIWWRRWSWRATIQLSIAQAAPPHQPARTSLGQCTPR